MEKRITICLAAIMIFAAAGQLRADWQKMNPAPDVDKEFISGNPGVRPGVPAHVNDNSCWMATAANMLAGAGYGNGVTVQERADDIYLDMLNWQRSIDPTNIHGVRDGGWVDNALNWWLNSPNNTWGGFNPYTVVTVYGDVYCNPWADTDGPRFIGNQLRDCQSVGLGLRWPRSFIFGSCVGGHAITAWGDDGNAGVLTTNPTQIIVSDSDDDNDGNLQIYDYDIYTNPNPEGFNEGYGWYINYLNNNLDHPYILQVITLCPTDIEVDPHDKPFQKVVGSLKRHQRRYQMATDLHYNVYTDYDILGYRTEIDWPTSNSPVIVESNAHHDSLTRDTIHVDWDLSDNPIPYCKWVTITTEFILHDWNGVWYDDVYFTYGAGAVADTVLPPFGWEIITPKLIDVNIVDITGGFVVGAFDLYDFSLDEPDLMGQYRFIHQYSYTQDPEQHMFTIRGGNERYADFDDLTEGISYRVGEIFETQGYQVTCREFYFPDGNVSEGGYVGVYRTTLSGGTSLGLQFTSANAEFDFGEPVSGVSFLFGEYGSNINLQVNGDLRNVEDFVDVNGLTVGRCLVTVTGDQNRDTGKVLIQGEVDQFMLGGQELVIDDVSLFCEDIGRYVATNFHFGHSYGMLDTESLWQFNDWMTILPSRAELSLREPFSLTIDWDGRLPYPPSNITPIVQDPNIP